MGKKEATKARKKYRVELNAPTPVRDSVLEVEAENEQEAQSLFFQHNRLSGTTHPIKVEEIQGDGDSAGKSEDSPREHRSPAQGSDGKPKANVLQ